MHQKSLKLFFDKAWRRNQRGSNLFVYDCQQPGIHLVGMNLWRKFLELLKVSCFVLVRWLLFLFSFLFLVL